MRNDCIKPRKAIEANEVKGRSNTYFLFINIILEIRTYDNDDANKYSI
jgi:hypothetical protein